MEDGTIKIGVMLLGVIAWRVSRRFIFGRFWVVALALLVPVSAFAGPKPVGFADVYQVAMAGGQAAFVASSGGFRRGPVGAAVMTWDETAGQYVYFNAQASPSPFNFWGAPKIVRAYMAQTDPAVVSGGMGTGYQWVLGVEDGTVSGFFGVYYRTKAANPVGATWEIDPVSYCVDTGYGAGLLPSSVYAEFFGQPGVSVAPGVGGSAYGQDMAHHFGIRWQENDALWKLSTGEKCAPSLLLRRSWFWGRLTPSTVSGVIGSGGFVAGAGYLASDVATMAEWNLAEQSVKNTFLQLDSRFPLSPVQRLDLLPFVTAGDVTRQLQSLGYQAPGWFTTTPYDVSWDNTYGGTNFGGYGTFVIEVAEVEYKHLDTTVEYDDASSGSHVRQTKTIAVLGVRAKAGGKSERWVVVYSTEPDTRKPYVEIRKTSGERVRLYSAGFTTSLYSNFGFESDGKTIHHLLGNGDPSNAAVNMTATRQVLSGVWVESQNPFTNAVSNQSSWPAPALTQADAGTGDTTFDPGVSFGTGAGQWATGTTTQPTTAPSILERAKGRPEFATSRPAFLGHQVNTMVASGSAAEAFNDFANVLEGFGLSTVREGVGILGGAGGLTWQDLLMPLMSWPDLANSFAGGVFSWYRLLTSCAMVFWTLRYTLRRGAWALGMRDADKIEPPEFEVMTQDQIKDEWAGPH